MPRLQLVFESSPVLELLLDRSGRVLAASGRARAAFALTEGAVAAPCIEPVSAGLSRYVQLLVERGTPFRIGDLLLRTPAGALRVDARGRKLDSEHVAVTMLDLSELEGEDLLRAQKERSETLARFAGGLSHDLANMLGAIVATAQAGAQDVADAIGDPAADFRAIIAEAERGAALARSLRALVFEETGSWRPIDLRQEARAVANVLSRGREGAQIVLDLAEDAPEIVGDRARLHQLVLNLAVNARDAARQTGGGLELELERTEEGGARLRVLDDGPGIPEPIRARIFEPYFTTKRRGSEQWGTGLGLAIVDAVARATGASIRVDSRPDRSGAVFAVTWPASATLSLSSGEPSESTAPFRVRVVARDGRRKELLERRLRGRGLHIAEGTDPAVLLLDGQGPDGSLPDVPALVLTGVPAGRCPERRGLRCVGEPLDVGDLAAAIRAAAMEAGAASVR